MRHRPGARYLRIILRNEEIDCDPWGCFWIIGWQAHRHGVASRQLDLVSAKESPQWDEWLLTFEIKEA
jgi:hypothetical protein